jgi:multidrug efflux pump subunit AcrA (membrane-fusion protein)
MSRLSVLIGRRGWIAAIALAALASLVALAWSRPTVGADANLTAVVTRGTLQPRLTVTGTLRPVQSLTYRSPLGGREVELVFLVAEGTRVNEGDQLVRLDTTDLQLELARATQELRQVQVDLQVADIDRQQSQAALDSLTGGEGAIGVQEATVRRQLAEKKVQRLKEELAGLEPLMTRGFITREEYRRTADSLEQAEEELALVRQRADVLIDVTRPQERQRAKLLRAQKDAQYENVRLRLTEVEARQQRLAEQIDACSIYARSPGLVVHEEYLSASPRRKVRPGDRVTGTQGLVTIPDVERMNVETSVSEADMGRVHVGQKATVWLEAVPGRPLTGRVAAIGALARSNSDRPFDDKRFDVVIALDPADVDVRPEMTARADIALAARPDVLLIPVTAVFEQQGELVVHLAGLLGRETRRVELGEMDGAFVEVVGGLDEGDRISLIDVASSATSRDGPSPAGRGAGPAAPVKRGRD